MPWTSSLISESLSEYLILTGWVRTKPEKVSLKAELGNISLQYPYMTARMQCVVGPEMAVAAGRNGILTIIPRSLRDEDKQKIINANNRARLKKGDIEFIDEPETATPDSTLEEVVKKVERTGHSIIPITDRKSRTYGVYVHDPENPPLVSPLTLIKKVMLPIKESDFKQVPCLVNNEDTDKIKRILSDKEKKFSYNKKERDAPYECFTKIPLMDLYDFITKGKLRKIPASHVCGAHDFNPLEGDTCPACKGKIWQRKNIKSIYFLEFFLIENNKLY